MRYRRGNWNPGTIRMSLAIVGSVLIYLTPVRMAWGDVSGLLLPVAITGAVGGVLAIWLRALGGALMFAASVTGFCFAIGEDLWMLLGPGLLMGCAISAWWRRLRRRFD